MNKTRRIHLFPEIIAALYVLLFLYTALAKTLDRSGFEWAIRHSPLIGWAAKPLSWIIPAIEWVIVVLLVIPRSRPGGLQLSTLLMFIFTIYVAYNLLFEPVLPCTCGGIIEEMSWPQHMAFNSLFLLFGIISLTILKRNFIAISRSRRIPV